MMLKNETAVRASSGALTQTFLEEALEGLSRHPKEIPGKYLFDKEGSLLFDRVCDLQSFHSARAEMTLLKECGTEIAELIGPNAMVVECGAGNGLNARLLLDRLEDVATYVPMDISAEYLAETAFYLQLDYPRAEILPFYGDFTQNFELPSGRKPYLQRSCVIFSSILSDFGPASARRFLEKIRRICGREGFCFAGIDFMKGAPESAYRDNAGLNAAFNRNLLVRLNREAEADFKPETFRYEAHFNAGQSRVETFLISAEDQTVRVAGREVAFEKGEKLRTRRIHKYSPAEFEQTCESAGYAVRRRWVNGDATHGIYCLQPRSRNLRPSSC